MIGFERSTDGEQQGVAVPAAQTTLEVIQRTWEVARESNASSASLCKPARMPSLYERRSRGGMRAADICFSGYLVAHREPGTEDYTAFITDLPTPGFKVCTFLSGTAVYEATGSVHSLIDKSRFDSGLSVIEQTNIEDPAAFINALEQFMGNLAAQNA